MRKAKTWCVYGASVSTVGAHRQIEFPTEPLEDVELESIPLPEDVVKDIVVVRARKRKA